MAGQQEDGVKDPRTVIPFGLPENSHEEGSRLSEGILNTDCFRLENALAVICFVLLVAESVRFRHGLAVPKELPGGPDRRRQAFSYGRRLDADPVRCVRAFPVGDGKLFAA